MLEPAPSCQPGLLMPSGHVGICSLGGRDAVLWRVKASQRAGVSRGGPALVLASSRLGGGNLPAVFVLVKQREPFTVVRLRQFGLIQRRLEPRMEVTPKAISVAFKDVLFEKWQTVLY